MASQVHHAAGASHLRLARARRAELSRLAPVEVRTQVARAVLPRLYLLLELRDPLLGEPRRLQLQHRLLLVPHSLGILAPAAAASRAVPPGSTRVNLAPRPGRHVLVPRRHRRFLRRRLWLLHPPRDTHCRLLSGDEAAQVHPLVIMPHARVEGLRLAGLGKYHVLVPCLIVGQAQPDPPR